MISSPQSALSTSAPAPARRGGSEAAPARQVRALRWATVALALLSIAPGPHARGASPLLPFVFFVALALAAEALPVAGPRGRRISVGDGVGLSALLLLPATLAPLPLLLAGLLHGVLHGSRAAQRAALANGLCLGAAALVGGWVYHRAGAAFSLPAALAALIVYGLLLAGGRLWAARMRRRDWRLDGATLVASAPAALLTARTWPHPGPTGLLMTAALLGLVMVVAHLAFEAARLREQVRAMEQLSAVPLAQNNLPRLVERFLQLGSGLAAAHRASLWLADDSKLCLERAARLRADWSEADSQRTQILSVGPAALRFGEGPVGRVAERQLSKIVQNWAHGACPGAGEAEERNGAPCSLLLMPLLVGGETVGVAEFERDGPQPFTRRDLEGVQALAGQTAAAIVNAQRHRDVTTLAVTDGLTGLFNRRHVQTALETEQRRALRYGHSLSVIMLDIDNFKSYNDAYGHTQGDVLIKRVAGILRAGVRNVDVVGRYGGEEFIVLLPETTKEEAGRTAERLRQAVAATVFPGFADDPEMAVLKTISLGVATLPDDAGDAGMLVTMADQALYQAKRGGRNRVVLAETAGGQGVAAK